MQRLVATTSTLARKPCVRTHYVRTKRKKNNAKFSGHYVCPRTETVREHSLRSHQYSDSGPIALASVVPGCVFVLLCVSNAVCLSFCVFLMLCLSCAVFDLHCISHAECFSCILRIRHAVYLSCCVYHSVFLSYCVFVILCVCQVMCL